MISIIICSRTKTISSDLSQNIQNTIGCGYELIIIDNSENKYSIYEAYNIGIERSTNDYVCFIHDDILFHTEGWGNKVKDIFRDDLKIGLIGVAGSKIKTTMPSAWWDCLVSHIAIYIIQHSKIEGREIEKIEFGFDGDIKDVEVVFIDGVFMAMRKDKQIRFNNIMTGFHNYDLNISIEYKKSGYKVVVTNRILLEHYSIGIIDKEWVISAFEMYNIYKKSLPLKVLSSFLTTEIEFDNGKKFITKCMEFKNYRTACFVWWKLFCLHPISKYHIKFWKVIFTEQLKYQKFNLFSK